MNSQEFPKTLTEAVKFFSDKDTCVRVLADIRWSEGVTCPHCESTKVSFVKTRRIWNCLGCRKQFSVKVGTVMEDSPLGLDKWLIAFWLLTSCKNGVSSYEIHRHLGITQKSAWFLMHRARYALQKGSLEKFSGQVEADETFIGGKARNMHLGKRAVRILGRGPSGKAIVLGLLDRKHGKGSSQVQAVVLQGRRKKHIQTEVRARVEPSSSCSPTRWRHTRGWRSSSIRW